MDEAGIQAARNFRPKHAHRARHFCKACGDLATRWMHIAKDEAHWYCWPCYAELRHGRIMHANIVMSGGTRAKVDGDIGSYRTNAVRHLEER